MTRQVSLRDFDPDIVAQYRITTEELARVRRYVQLLQSRLPYTTWDDIALGGYYGTSALLHEIVELRRLLAQDDYLLQRDEESVRLFLEQHKEAHGAALSAEYLYLQDKIREVFGVYLNIAALVLANSRGEWENLFETNLPFTPVTPAELEEAEEYLERLKEVTR